MNKQVDTLGFKTQAPLLLTALGVLAIAATSSCGSGSSSSPDASNVHVQSGGAGGGVVDGGAAGAGGAVVDGGNDTEGDLVSDSGDAVVDSGVDAAPETCGPGGQGCAKLSVPLTDPQTGTFFAISFPAIDLSGVSAVFRFCLVPSVVQGSGWVQPYAQEGVSPYAGQFDVVNFTSIPACPSFIDYTFNVPDAPAPDASTDADAGSPWFTRVQTLGLKIQSLDGATGSWANPTVVYVDSVTLHRRTPDGAAPSDSSVVPEGDASNEGGTPDDGGAQSDGGVSNDGGVPSDAGAPQDAGAIVDGGATDGGAPDAGDATPDAVTTSDASALPPLPGPFTFDTSSSPFGVSTYMEVAGSQVDWVP